MLFEDGWFLIMKRFFAVPVKTYCTHDESLIANIAFNFLFAKWWYTNMIAYSYVQVSYTLNIMALIAEPSLKLIKHPTLSSLGTQLLN